MLERVYEKLAGQVPVVKEYGLTVSRAIHEAVLSGGEPTRKAADALHGTWLGHPLHVILTDFTIGAWSFGALFDLIGMFGDNEKARQTGDVLAKAGTLSAIPTAITGLTDFSTIPKPAAETATWHGTLNVMLLGVYLVSLNERKKGNRTRATALTASAMGLAMCTAWLGGHLVYHYRVGVDNSTSDASPEKWTPVLDDAGLKEQTPACVEVEGSRVLLYRTDGALYAMGAVCNHAEGPLEEGRFDAHYVQCPWHDSVFDLRDGSVRHGPAVHPQPNFEARVRKGKIEVRAHQG